MPLMLYPRPDRFDPRMRWERIRHQGILNYLVGLSIIGYPICLAIFGLCYIVLRLVGSPRAGRVFTLDTLIFTTIGVPASAAWSFFVAYRATRAARRAELDAQIPMEVSSTLKLK